MYAPPTMIKPVIMENEILSLGSCIYGNYYVKENSSLVTKIIINRETLHDKNP